MKKHRYMKQEKSNNEEVKEREGAAPETETSAGAQSGDANMADGAQAPHGLEPVPAFGAAGQMLLDGRLLLA